MNNLLHWVLAERASLVIEFGPAILFALAWLGLKASTPSRPSAGIDRTSSGSSPGDIRYDL